MMQPATIFSLNRLLALLGKSFPQYLQYSRPHIPLGRESVMDTIGSIVTDQKVLEDRISQMLIDAEVPIRTGEFPMEFTDMHDLGIDFLVNRAIGYQEQDIASIGWIADHLDEAPAAKALAEEALGMAKGHLEALQELLAAGVK